MRNGTTTMTQQPRRRHHAAWAWAALAALPMAMWPMEQQAIAQTGAAPIAPAAAGGRAGDPVTLNFVNAEVEAVAQAAGLALREQVQMPANNLLLVWAVKG